MKSHNRRPIVSTIDDVRIGSLPVTTVVPRHSLEFQYTARPQNTLSSDEEAPSLQSSSGFHKNIALNINTYRLRFMQRFPPRHFQRRYQSSKKKAFQHSLSVVAPLCLQIWVKITWKYLIEIKPMRTSLMLDH